MSAWRPGAYRTAAGAAQLRPGLDLAGQRVPHFRRVLLRQVDLMLNTVNSEPDRLVGLATIDVVNEYMNGPFSHQKFLLVISGSRRTTIAGSHRHRRPSRQHGRRINTVSRIQSPPMFAVAATAVPDDWHGNPVGATPGYSVVPAPRRMRGPNTARQARSTALACRVAHRHTLVRLSGRTSARKL